MLVDLRARRGDGSRDAEDILQRMEVERVALQQAAVIAARFQLRGERGGVDRLPLDTKRVFHQTPLRLEACRFVEPVCENHTGVAVVAFDPVARHALSHHIDRIGCERVELASPGGSEDFQQIGAVEAVAAEHKTAVASGRAEPHLLRFEHDDFAHAALDKPKRCRQTGEAAADNAYVGGAFAGQRRPLGANHGGFVKALHEREEAGACFL